MLTDTSCPRIKYVGVHKEPSTIGDLYEVVVERHGNKPYHLNPRLDLVNHSPTGVCWGYGGSGPAQLALAILADYLKDDQRALSLYQDFKFAYVARLDIDAGWELTDQVLEGYITKLTVEQLKRS